MPRRLRLPGLSRDAGKPLKVFQDGLPQGIQLLLLGGDGLAQLGQLLLGSVLGLVVAGHFVFQILDDELEPGKEFLFITFRTENLKY